jgi:hypothetical protein
MAPGDRLSSTEEMIPANKKPTVFLRTLSASRVFPVDDSAKVESFQLCTLKTHLDQIKVKKIT